MVAFVRPSYLLSSATVLMITANSITEGTPRADNLLPRLAGPAGGQIGGGIEVATFTTVSGLESLRDFWTSHSGHRDGEMDFCLEHIQSSTSTLRAHVVVAYRGGQPRAMLAGRLDLNRLEQRFGYLRVPTLPSRALMFMGFRGEESTECCRAIIASVQETLGQGEADYAQIPTYDGAAIYRAALDVPGLLSRDHAPELSQNYLLRLQGDSRQVHAGLSANLRDQLRRKKKKIHADYSGQVRFAIYTEPAEVAAAIPDIEQVAGKTYQRGLGVGFTNTESMRRGLQSWAQRGWLRVMIAYLGDRPAAFSIGTVCNGTYTSDFLGFDPAFRDYSVGTLLQSELIERCCAESVKLIDFSAGYADYKKRFGNDCITVARVYLFAPSPKGVYLNGMRALTAGANRSGKFLLAKAGAISKIRNAWRSRTRRKPARVSKH
jgi:hypothetical protein